MNKKAKLSFATFAALSVIVPSAVIMAKGGNTLFSGKADDQSYTLTYDATHTVVDAVIKTNNGNDIWTKANYKASFTNNGIEFEKYGYVQNLTAINGITSVTLNVTSGTYMVTYGYFEPSDIADPQYFKANVSATTTLEFADNLPAYFRVQCTSDVGILSSIVVNYSCKNTGTDAYEETYVEGLENIRFNDSYQTGFVHWDTTETCQSDFAESKRSLKVMNPTLNESIFFVDVNKALTKGLDVNDGSKYLVFDVKSDASKMGQINPFMLAGRTKNNDLYGIGWQDPTGFIALPDNPGWYRYYWEVKAGNGNVIPLDQINNLAVVFAQAESPNKTYYFDNVHFTDELPTRQNALGGNYDFIVGNRFTATGNEVFSFKLKITEGVAKFGLGNWNAYYDFSLNADGTRSDGGGAYNGCYLVSLSNGWYKMYVATAEMNRINGAWKTWTFDGTDDDIKLMLNRNGNTGVGYVSEPFMESTNLARRAYKDSTVNNFASVTITAGLKAHLFYKVVSGKATPFKFWLSDNWDTSYGTFEFDYKGTAVYGDYAGVTTEKMGNGVIKVSLDFDAITKGSDTKPTSITMLHPTKWSATCGYVSNLVID